MFWESQFQVKAAALPQVRDFRRRSPSCAAVGIGFLLGPTIDSNFRFFIQRVIKAREGEKVRFPGNPI